MRVNRFSLVLGIGMMIAATAPAQPPGKPMRGIPRMASGKPDFNGVWQEPTVRDITVAAKDPRLQSGPKSLPFTDWGKQEFQSNVATRVDHEKSCLPLGALHAMNGPEPIQFIQDDRYLAILWEKDNWFQAIPLDGRKHREGEPKWFGDAVAHWENDTLVIDTVNFNGLTSLDDVGHPSSEQLHLTQKLSHLDATHIRYEVTVEDPKAYTKPWMNVRMFALGKNLEVKENSCEDVRASRSN